VVRAETVEATQRRVRYGNDVASRTG